MKLTGILILILLLLAPFILIAQVLGFIPISFYSAAAGLGVLLGFLTVYHFFGSEYKAVVFSGSTVFLFSAAYFFVTRFQIEQSATVFLFSAFAIFGLSSIVVYFSVPKEKKFAAGGVFSILFSLLVLFFSHTLRFYRIDIVILRFFETYWIPLTVAIVMAFLLYFLDGSEEEF